MPLCGHQETGSLSLDSVRHFCKVGEQGVLYAHLVFQVESGDTKHLETSPINCTMISPKIQNEKTIIINDLIIGKKLLTNSNNFNFYPYCTINY